MKDGFIRLGAASPRVSVGSAEKNADEIICAVHSAASNGVRVLAFPELSLTGVTCGALFYTETLLQDAKRALLRVTRECADCDVLFFVGLPYVFGGALLDCVAAVKSGRVLALIPRTLKSCESFEPGVFTTESVPSGECILDGCRVPVTPDALFSCEGCDTLTVACAAGGVLSGSEDIVGRLASAGATVIVSAGGDAELIGREEYRRTLAAAASGRHSCALLYAGAGEGESTTDFIFSGHCIIAENGSVRAQREPFTVQELCSCVADTEHLAFDRRKKKRAAASDGFTVIPFCFECTEDTCLDGEIDPAPFIPKGETAEQTTCARIIEMQSRALARRLEAAHARCAVVGISGGLDSCLALLVSVRAMEYLSRPMSEVLTVTMPCFGTTARTRGNAERLCEILGCSFRTVDIAEAVKLHFRDIGHDDSAHNVVYENAQARERTQIIMDIANAEDGIVVGTGDLSELALGWATYNGDHMSNYGVNAGIPKTLIRRVVAYCASDAESRGNSELAHVLRDILATPVSPELLPPKEGEIAQKTEDLVGPYELHDFFLYRFVRYGESVEKLYRTAKAAFAGVYSDEVIAGWLRVFMRRFFTQQFKRSALPDGVKIGSVGLSPRGDFNMPSDAAPWNIEL